MLLCSYRYHGADVAAARVNDQLVDLTALAERVDPSLPRTVLDWITSDLDAAAQITAILDQRIDSDVISDENPANFLAPIPRLPYSVLALAANYDEHLEEARASHAARGEVFSFKPSEKPCYFTKDPRTIIGPFDDIELDANYTARLDWEVELAVVIGRGGRDIPAESALDHVFGYSAFNDVSARDIARCQIWKMKNTYRSSPFGPYIVTPDSIADPQDLAIQCWVNGELMQDSRTSKMTHFIPALIADLSSGFMLAPGDVIATGTCTGTGNSHVPQVYLQHGDILETEVEGLGRQRNVIRAYSGT